MVPGWPSPGCPQQVGDRLRQQLQPSAGHDSGAQCSSPHPSAPQAPYCPSQGLPALPPEARGQTHSPKCCSPNLCTGLVPRGDRRVRAVHPPCAAFSHPRVSFPFSSLQTHNSISRAETTPQNLQSPNFTSPEHNRHVSPHTNNSPKPPPCAAPRQSRALGCRKGPSTGHPGLQAGLLIHQASLRSPASRHHNPTNSKTSHNPTSAAPKPLRSCHEPSSHQFLTAPSRGHSLQ